MLLLLDNLEQVLGAAGDIAALVSRCPSAFTRSTRRSRVPDADERASATMTVLWSNGSTTAAATRMSLTPLTAKVARPSSE